MPRESDARDLVFNLRQFGGPMAINIELHTSSASSRHLGRERTVDVFTPAALLSRLDAFQDQSYFDSLSLVLCENLELLDDSYELAVSLLLYKTQTNPVRFVGLSASLNDMFDLADWLNVHSDNIYDFRPSDRDQVLSNSSQAFSLTQSSSIFKAMIKPLHIAIRALAMSESTVVFVPSRPQCRIVAKDLITECAIEMNIRGFVAQHITEDELERRLLPLKDRSLVDWMMQGIGILHPGILAPDRLLTLELFADGILRVLIVPRETCWTLPVRASLVVVMGTQYYQLFAPSVGRDQLDSHRDDRVLKDYSIHELLRMQGLAIQHGKAGRFHLLCSSQQRDVYMRFLEEGLPLESSLISSYSFDSDNSGTDEAIPCFASSEVLRGWLAKRRETGSIRGKQDAMDFLSHTFLWRRMKSNPSYYGVRHGERDFTLSRFVDHLFKAISPVPAPAPSLPSIV
jgi:antiviral helicase SLH1